MLGAGAAATFGGCVLRSDATLKIAAASNLRGISKPLEDLLPRTIRVDWTFASSGKLATQICAGLPVDLFLSADRLHAETVHACFASTSSKPKEVVNGRLAWYPIKPSTMPSRVVIANPAAAPFGLAAVQTLESIGWAATEIVIAGSAAAVLQMVAAGAAEFGLSAASFHRSRIARRTAIVSSRHHQPVTQYGVRMDTLNRVAVEFLDILAGHSAVQVWEDFGYEPVVASEFAADV